MMTLAIAGLVVSLRSWRSGVYFGYKKYHARQTHEVHVIKRIDLSDLKKEIWAGPSVPAVPVVQNEV